MTDLDAELLRLCRSPAADEAGLRALLEAGADPNAAEDGLPALYALTGERNAPALARLLLEAGASPNDGESVFHAAEHFHLESLELLREFGVDLNLSGDWGNTPLYFLLRYHDGASDGLRWLLAHGADPDVLCGPERESSLHVAVRRGQPAGVVQLLLEHGADVHARRGDGRTPWRLARRGGADEIAALLEAAGAAPEELDASDRLYAACSRGDAEAAAGLATAPAPDDLALLPEAASRGRADVVRACLAAGFPVDTPDELGATALHHAAIHGDAALVRDLLAHGADATLYDAQHGSTPLGWAQYGREAAIEPEGDYAACELALGRR